MRPQARASAVKKESSDIRNFIHIKVNYLPTSALVDTGCFCSCISPELVRQLKLTVLPLNENEYSQVLSANCGRIRVFGKVDVSLNFAGLLVPYTLYVLENLIHAVMLGMDILKELRANIDLSSNRISFYDNLVTLPITKSHKSEVMLRSVKAVTLPPCSESLIPVQYQEPFMADTALIEPLPTLQKRCVLAARVTVKPHNNRTFCRLLNPNNTPKRIRKNEVIAAMSPVIIPEQLSRSPEMNSINTISQPPSMSEMEKTLSDLEIKIERSHLTSQQYTELCTLIFQNKDLFATDASQLPGTSLVVHHIDTGDSRPVRSRPYRHSLDAKKEIARQIEAMYKKDLIRPTMSAWSSPVILVKKPHSNEYRFTVDYRRLNAVSKPMHYPLPTMDEIRDILANKPARYYSLVDLKAGYHQCMMTEESQEKAAFCTSDSGNWAPKRLFFGLQGSPATFQMLMMKVLAGLQEYSLVYVDDVCIFSPDWYTHLQHLQSVFDRIRQHNLRLHPKKCFFALREIKYLGHVISEHGIKPDADKLKLIQHYPSPQNQKQLRSALGLMNYYRKFCKDYAKKTECLRQLLQHNIPFVWTEEHERAFQELKDMLCCAPVLAHADMSKQMILTCDGCISGLGYVLSFKDNDGVERVIEFAGRGLRPNEKRFGISEIECLAVLSGIQYFSTYLANKKFLLRTDHSALQFLKNIKNPSGRLARWAIYLSQYTFEVQHVPGKSLANADAISRMPFDRLPFTPPIPAADVIDEVVVNCYCG